MRGTRWLVLVAIAAILGGIVTTYRAQKKSLLRHALPKPPALPLDLNSSAEDWHWAQFDPQRPCPPVDITAKAVKQLKETSRVELQGVVMKIAHKDCAAYDLVNSAQASFMANDRKMFSDGEVQITLGVPTEGAPAHRLVSIKTSGASFDSTTGKAETERPATFVFEEGEGRCVGAVYDPPTRTLIMKSQAMVEWKGRGPKGRKMKVESGELQYHEAQQEIWLQPWSRLTRDNAVVEGGNAMVHLQDGVARLIEAKSAHGTEIDPHRKLEYAADLVSVTLNENGETEKVTGADHARLVSTGAGSQTTLTANRVDLDFVPGEGGSVLAKAAGMGACTTESKPLPVPGRQTPETHVLRADTLRLIMRPGGREIQEVATDSAGDLEFLPNLPTQHYRKLNGERLYIYYGAQNRIESFRAVEARTRTEPTADERKRNRMVSRTSSRNLLAKFEPKTGKLATMEQWDDFNYEEGDRHARAARAGMDGEQNVITLETGARMWDAAGSTTADRIRMDQKAGIFVAEGRVDTSRMPEHDKKKKSSEMLSGDDPVQARARKMTSTDHNRHVLYEGGVVMWQGANRINGDRVEVDRVKRTLVADGRVRTDLWEQPQDPKDGAGPKGQKKTAAPKQPVLTVVRARHLDYTEQNRLAHYTGDVVLTRPALQVKAADLRAFLAESGSESRLERAFGDGKVEIFQTSPGMTRTGTGEHAEYYTADEKLILKGGEPTLVETARGSPRNVTRGAELTYFANDDRLLVNGAPGQPASSRIRRK